METLHPRCAGLDVHQRTIVACVLLADAGPRPVTHVQSFGTLPADLVALRDWLRAHAVTHVLMEATGVYWLPVYTVLCDTVDVTVGNARHLKNVPGRKTDALDARWLARLMASGLVRKSFVPDAAQRVVRELARARVATVEAHTRALNQVTRLLESVGVKLASVVSNMRIASVQRILRAVAAGETDAARLAALALGRLRTKRAQLAAVFAVPVDADVRWLLGEHLTELARLDDRRAALDARLTAALAAHQPVVARLVTIPGLNTVIAQGLVAELGTTLATFATADQLAAWAGLCPGQHESAGVARGRQIGPGNAYVKRLLAQAAWAAVRSPRTWLRTKFYQLRARLGDGKAIIAIAHKLLRIVFRVLKDGVTYQDRPPQPPTEQARQRAIRHHVAALERLGITLVPDDPTPEVATA